ncbi:hypothetical protein GCM10009789_33440 [Kribbella sancticallisti]|uniref:Uncharacterized protein n=1 Tax=Kribbella sancticallisti TaxID=460087 RepID=A0ABN2DJZ4_9ACTN
MVQPIRHSQYYGHQRHHGAHYPQRRVRLRTSRPEAKAVHHQAADGLSGDYCDGEHSYTDHCDGGRLCDDQERTGETTDALPPSESTGRAPDRLPDPCERPADARHRSTPDQQKDQT